MTIELDPGQRHTFGAVPVRVTLTGMRPAQPVELRVLDQAGSDAVAKRLGSVEVMVVPVVRRLRLVARPLDGGAFLPGTQLGLTLRSEVPGTGMDQILVSEANVGALQEQELAVLEFTGEQRAVVQVSARDDGGPVPVATGVTVRSGEAYDAAPVAGARGVSDAEVSQQWLEQGLYALRDARKIGTVATAPSTWGIVLDGSSSLLPMYRKGELASLLALVMGIEVHWTRRWPVACAVAGVRVTAVDRVDAGPDALQQVAFGGEPATWAAVGAAAELVAGKVGAGGSVVVVSDSVPGDFARLVEVAGRNRAVRFTLVCTGASRHGLPSDGFPNWWEEELGSCDLSGSEGLVDVVSVRVDAEGALLLGGQRAAEFALLLTTPAACRVSS